MLAFCVSYIVAMAWCAQCKHIAVLGGMMKSHHLTVVPIIEGLLEKGHKVSFLMPNTTEAKSYFPKGVGNATMVYLGTQDWSFDTLFKGEDVDVKNQPLYQKVVTYAKLVWSYRKTLGAPLLSMHDELVEWIKQPGIDAVLLHLASLAAYPVVEASGIPFVDFLSIPPMAAGFVHDADVQCRYPNMIQPPRVQDLKSSLIVRVSNHMHCRFLQAYMVFVDHEFRAIFRTKGLPWPGFVKMMTQVPHGIVLGGPPLSLKLPLPPGMHLVGTVEKSKPSPIPVDILGWLDAAKHAGERVMYVSLGTKYEFTEKSCSQLVAHLNEMVEQLGLRILWSLRASQQEKLASVLPINQGVSIRIEKFTPQPEVLQHGSVKVFLSHCGWGGVTDTIAAGVPVLGYPGMAEQFLNARSLEEAGAGIMLNGDFSNLFESAKALLGDPKYTVASKAAGEMLRSYGGLDRALDIVEGAASGQYLTPDVNLHAMMKDVDPFFETPQPMEQWISFCLFSALFLLLVLGPCWCCRRLCQCCCRDRGKKPSEVEEIKKRQ
eukprot:TRINITY_DN4451_c0_g1_i1.p1 TRINITY_DN4451_c0_g1~~TRINITY_DN4451_c0_g1_i1.p1  ORF type:complete len:544 (-),score=84.30 TRINITY_DN4451_c0_g1_i1:139-1770(-)